MRTIKLDIWDRRMLNLMDYLISEKLVKNQRTFLANIGFMNAANLQQVLSGKQSFRHEHFLAASNLYNVSMEWFYGFTQEMTRINVKKLSGIEMLKQAVRVISEEFPAFQGKNVTNSGANEKKKPVKKSGK